MWDYTKGLPENNGLVKYETGSPVITSVSNGLNISVPSESGNSLQYKYEAIGYTDLKTRVTEEITFIINTYSTDASCGLRVYNGLGGGENAQNCAEVLIANNGTQTGIAWLAEASGWSVLSSSVISTNESHTFKLIQVSGSCAVYLDDVLVGTLTSFREAVGFPSFTVNRGMDITIQSFKLCVE